MRLVAQGRAGDWNCQKTKKEGFFFSRIIFYSNEDIRKNPVIIRLSIISPPLFETKTSLDGSCLEPLKDVFLFFFISSL